jgi:uncharacterized protein YegP (UPF0339 family)
MKLSGRRKRSAPGVHGTVVFRGNDNQWYFNIVSPNGQVVATSEGYTRKWSAKRGARTAERVLKAGFGE